MADKKIILEVELLEGNAQSKLDVLNASLKNLDKTHKDYKPTLKLIAEAERDLSKVQQKRILIEKKLTSSTGNVDKATKKTAKQMKQLSSDTGASTSATLELGRVFSDAPYGIRGVANNIQQLASNLFFMSKKTNEATGKTIGFGGAVGSLLKNLIGPAGILVAFQAGVALLDYFSGGMKKAGNSADDYVSSLEGLEKTLSKLYISQEDVNLKFDEYTVLAKLRIDTDAIMKKEAGKLADLNEKIEKQEEFNKTAKTRRIGNESKQQEALNKLLTERNLIYTTVTDAKNKLNKKTEEFNASIKGSVSGLEKHKSNLIKEQKELSTTREKFLELQAAIDETQKSIDKITKAGITLRPKVEAIDTEGLEKGIDVEALAKIEGELIIEPKVVATKAYDEIAEFIKNYKVLMSGLTDFIDGEFERELTIEQNKTNAINAELNNRLNNENLSKDQRASIQNQIAQNDEKLRVKQEAIARKQFKVTKAFNIAMTIADTYMAAQKAYLSQMQFDPTSPIRAKIAAGIAVAAGLAKVAAISRTQFQTTAPSTPTNVGGGGSIGGRAEPSFNIVGRSNDNILLSAIQSQFDQPLRAYVVARDVTNQQQLDGVISTSAST